MDAYCIIVLSYYPLIDIQKIKVVRESYRTWAPVGDSRKSRSLEARRCENLKLETSSSSSSTKLLLLLFTTAPPFTSILMILSLFFSSFLLYGIYYYYVYESRNERRVSHSTILLTHSLTHTTTHIIHWNHILSTSLLHISRPQTTPSHVAPLVILAYNAPTWRSYFSDSHNHVLLRFDLCLRGQVRCHVCGCDSSKKVRAVIKDLSIFNFIVDYCASYGKAPLIDTWLLLYFLLLTFMSFLSKSSSFPAKLWLWTSCRTMFPPFLIMWHTHVHVSTTKVCIVNI